MNKNAVWSYLATGNSFIFLHYQYTIGATTVREIVKSYRWCDMGMSETGLYVS